MDAASMPRSPIPPTPAQLTRVLAELGVADSVAAALHLATPENVRVGINVRDIDGVWAWKDRRVRGADPVVVAAAIGAMEMSDGVRWLDLTGPAWSWVKPARSGSRIVAFGSELLGGPVIAGEDVDAPALLRVWRACLERRLSPPVVVPGNRPLLVSGDDRYWLVTPGS